ncbi:MBL fold metallo-hydrolase [Campylobacter concisus]|uniref:MBL fold metallo-hydrolase n=1 Tax=Campylobacter concisus TaxID=199 RepID=UPI000CD8B364|nr:MBL fold metallo-hydrolase [Campylobacter concisus]MBE9818609.1 MBL fold metallo-hydrolase [Campylobacter concisus]
MRVIHKSFGDFGTNCYIVTKDNSSLVIDPGDGAKEWVLQNAKNLKAILCTHGHFDHIFDAGELKDELEIPIYINKSDAFMCESDIFGYMKSTFTPDILVGNDENFNIDDFCIKFHHFPGHTPGCSMIEIDDAMFSGDFLFRGSIGRWDFPFSDKNEMLKSLEKCKNLKGNFTLYPGHGEGSTLKTEQNNIGYWIGIVKNS